MSKVKISKQEFLRRINEIKNQMIRQNLNGMIVYGDEYRKENLRYVSNYWPIFERGALFLPVDSDPVVLCAPEGQKVAEEMSVWSDVRPVPDFVCVTVPDAIDYPLAKYTSFESLAKEYKFNDEGSRLGIVGEDAMSAQLLQSLKSAFKCETVNASSILYDLRKEKTAEEIACLREAARIADAGIFALIEADLIGKTELEAAAIAEAKARNEGAETIIFTVFGSGERTNTIVGRPTSKIIENGDMIMCALAVQYEGYVATCEFPFAVGDVSDDTKRVIDVLIRASAAGVAELRPGNQMKNMVMAVRNLFKDEGLSEFDVYPPLHGIGCAEAESPYPDEKSEEVFKAGMTVNTDISLFGLSGGSNRIEEGFVITENGAESLSPLVNKLCKDWLNENN